MANSSKGDFSQGSVLKTVFRLALPIMLAEIVHITYNIVDRLYIGRMPEVGTAALTGVGVAFPLISLITAFAQLFGTGGAPLSSIARGQGDNEKAGRIQQTSFTMMIIVGAAVTAIMFFGAPLFLSLLGGDEETLPYALAYFRIYVLGTIPVMISLGMNPFINNQGFTRTGMMTVLIGAALNIVLDPILIYNAGMGVKGAAVATVISQIASAVWVVIFLTGKRPIVRIRGLGVSGTDLKDILKLGSTGFMFKATNSITQAITNIVLKSWGGAMSTLYIGSMTIINSVREITMCPCNGIVSGATPVMSFNYGAGKPERVSQALGVMLWGSLIINFAFWSIMVFAPGWMFSIFTNNPELIETGSKCARVYFLLFPMMSLQLTGQNTFISLNYPKYALFFSMLRKIILVAPLTLLLPYLGFGVMGAFWAETISQIIGATACFTTMYLKIWRRLKRAEI
ncbi:MAG: MATE family efflux transporter [Firmicutes bacterium]|nr:MATE family efflux transporter [Bacillota bacterium]